MKNIECGFHCIKANNIGVKIGNAFGSRFKTTAERIGGIILILMGIKILLEHLQVF